MAPHQTHYRAKMRKHGWVSEAGEMIWPRDVEGRQDMARGLFGLELISSVDYWTLLAEDELDGTFEAPWASPDKTLQPDVKSRRATLHTLSSEQREAVRELLRYVMKGHLHSLCVHLDQKLGGATILLEQPNDKHDETLEIHSPRRDELKYEQFQWLEDFSIIFGEDERYRT